MKDMFNNSCYGDVEKVDFKSHNNKSIDITHLKYNIQIVTFLSLCVNDLIFSCLNN